MARAVELDRRDGSDGGAAGALPGRFPEPILRRIEDAGPLDRLGRRLTKIFARRVRPGPVKDALAGTWMGHPAHPMLTDVAIGAWASAGFCDVVGGRGSQDAARALVGAGLLAAVPTAATGWSELADIVDPKERAVATAHALGNTGALILYGLSWLSRRSGRSGAGRALGLLGLGALTGAGFLGGHLAFRRGVGVNSTAFDDPLRRWTPLIALDELTEGKPKRARAGRTDVMLYRTGDRIDAIADRCSHRGGPLSKGRVADRCVTCPWHLSTFSLDDGSVVRGPATAPQPVFDVRVREGTVEVRARGLA